MASITIATISRGDLEKLPDPPTASITSVEHLSSYNWIEAPRATPIIAVPGSPPRWSPPKGPKQLKKDSGLVYIAQNSYRLPDTPLEPLFRALHITKPSFDLGSVDVVTDRNNLRKLLSFITPGSSRNGLEPFTISIEVTKGVVLFCRQETKTHEIITSHEFRGFGHEFEKEYTEELVSGGTGHHRIISYLFGGLKFLVRHETDGFVAAKPSSGGAKEPDAIAGMLESLSLSSTTNIPITKPAGSKLTIRGEGETVPLASTLEIKTRVFHKRLPFKEVAAQLWVSQTPMLVEAYHQRGLFQEPEVKDMKDAVAAWEEDNREHLVKLAALIKRIIHLTNELGGTAIMTYVVEGDKLVITKSGGKRMLPDDLYSKWEAKEIKEAKKEVVPEASKGNLAAHVTKEK